MPLRALQAALTFAALVTPVLALNWHYFGNVVPLSGAAKSSFPHATADNVNRRLAARPGRRALVSGVIGGRSRKNTSP